MKTSILLALFSLLIVLSVDTYAAEIKDCSVYSKLNPKYLACKTANIAKNAINYQNEQWSSIKKKKEDKKD